MKKNWLLLVLTLFSLSMGFSSCSDDDDQKSTEAGILSFKFDKDVVSENSLVFGEPEIKEEFDEAVYDEQISMMEMVLDVDDIVSEMTAIRDQVEQA